MAMAVMLPLSDGRDTFWILKGLLVSGMHQTATGMVRNLVSLAAAHGHVPNGMRSYYLNRSQPPLLSAMVKLVAHATGDQHLIAEAYSVCTACCRPTDPWLTAALRSCS